MLAHALYYTKQVYMCKQCCPKTIGKGGKIPCSNLKVPH